MPELPEVETMRRGIAEAIGSRVVNAQWMRGSCKPIAIHPGQSAFRRRIRGATITELGRVGKRVVIWLDSKDAIVIEPRMTGLVLVVDPPTAKHLRWRLQLKGSAAGEILYWDRRGLGSIRLMSRTQFQKAFGPSQLGPDALEISAVDYQRMLGKSRREIKPALLDQRAVAGIGNLYASEILHLAGIHPQRRCQRMSRLQWESLALATHKVLKEAIRYEGSTLSDGTYRNALNNQGRYQNEHQVYNRNGLPCLRCRTSHIQRIVQSQRSTFFCAGCQRRTGALDIQ
ncbi:MAG: bifunctional DNA-formamidopyrimidine glycosylase/DNA-(apurinic or apyrimidinic site) lyase [Pirellulales bacterium]|nr:bifunctional DNA-formamidopyrimidine glycosylase/DNA-(apurinic or apyrimidinic site) lyase [Pirellulales bacterium]